MKLRRADRKQTLIWAGVGLALFALLYILSPILMPFAIGAVFAYIFDPFTSWLTRHRISRPFAALIAMAGAALVALSVLLIVLPAVYTEGGQFIRGLPELIERLNTQFLPRINEFLGTSIQFDVASLRTWLQSGEGSSSTLITTVLAQVRDSGLALVATIANLVLIPIVMFYLLLEWPRVVEGIRSMLPRPILPATEQIVGEIDSVMSEFLRGQLSVMMLLAVFYSIGLWIAGLTFALPVGVFTGLVGFIPYVGFGGGLVLAILAALLQGGTELLIGVAVVYALGQVIESYVFTPYLVGERIGLHPLAVIFALMAFGQLYGFVGMLIALPASAAILVGLRYVRDAWVISTVYLGDQTVLTEEDVTLDEPSPSQVIVPLNAGIPPDQRG